MGTRLRAIVGVTVGCWLLVLAGIGIGFSIWGGDYTYSHPCAEDEYVSAAGACVHGDEIERQFGDGVDR